MWIVAVLMLLACVSAGAQQPQPLTFWSDYTVKPGREEDFMNLVKAVGQPVREKLMAEGVVLAWGIEVPLLRGPYPTTHTIWYAVADWSGIEKVQNTMNAQLARIAADEAAAAAEARKKGQKVGPTTAERIRDILEMDKTRDWVTRDLVFVESSKPAPANVLPYTFYFGAKVKPGRGNDYTAAWRKYYKPVLDKLAADGVLLAFGLAIEEVRTEGAFTHFTWIAVANLPAFDKARAAFVADRAVRSPEEQAAIGDLFNNLTDADAARSSVSRSIVFRLPGMK
jgi:hypothetical protein